MYRNLERVTRIGALGIALLCASCSGGGAPGAAWNPDTADVLFRSDRDGNSEIYLRAGDTTEWVNLTDHPATDNWPEWSPDGGRIVFQSNRGGNLDIWVMNADGSNPVQLTDHPDHDYLPAWSPDGSRIAFTSWRSEADDEARANHIYVMNADGSDQRRFLEESPGTSAGIAWSHDGSMFALDRKVDDQGADIFLFDRDGNTLGRLTDDESYNGSPSFSPDGKRIAFYSDDGEVSRLEVVSIDGTSRRTVIEGRWRQGAHR